MLRLLILLFLIQSVTDFNPQPSEDSFLAKGHELEDRGQYEQALRIWSKASRKLDRPSLAIGRAYIRLDTEQKLESYYQTSAMSYQWGLSADQIAPNAEALSE